LLSLSEAPSSRHHSQGIAVEHPLLTSIICKQQWH